MAENAPEKPRSPGFAASPGGATIFGSITNSVRSIGRIPAMNPMSRKHLPVRRMVWAACALAGLASCSTMDEVTSVIVSSNARAAALLGNRVLQGQASFIQGRVGTLRLHSLDAPGLACFGPLQMTATSSGVATLACSDGQSIAIPFQVLSPMRGVGRSHLGEAVYGFTYGLSRDLAAAHLGVPVERLADGP